MTNRPDLTGIHFHLLNIKKQEDVVKRKVIASRKTRIIDNVLVVGLVHSTQRLGEPTTRGRD